MRPSPKTLLAAMLALVVLSGCGVPRPPVPPSLELPKPVTDLRAVRKGNNVFLSWTVPAWTMEHQTVINMGATRICRLASATLQKCDSQVGTALPLQMAPVAKAKGKKDTGPPKITANFVDSLRADIAASTPSNQLTYAIEVLNESGRSAGLSNLVQVAVVPVSPPPADFKVQVQADGIHLSWTETAPAITTQDIHYLYRVYRRQVGSNKDAIAGEVSAGTAQLVDSTFEWQKTYAYRATTVTALSKEGKPDVQLEGDDTPPISVFANDVFPPAVPAGLQAVFSGVGQQPFIDLIWSTGGESDLAGYYVFRREQGSQPAKVNTDLIKTPSYRDTDVQSGKTYFYSVTAVDVRGNESEHSPEASERVP